MTHGPLRSNDCSSEDFDLVKKYISDFELDDRQLQQQEFITVSNDTGLLAFGRVREFNGFSEICSLGVLEPERLKGIGKFISRQLINKARQSVYLVCIIPSFFESLGFVICNEFPAELQNKLNYCTNNLPVEEEYVVMKLS